MLAIDSFDGLIDDLCKPISSSSEGSLSLMCFFCRNEAYLRDKLKNHAKYQTVKSNLTRYLSATKSIDPKLLVYVLGVVYYLGSYENPFCTVRNVHQTLRSLFSIIISSESENGPLTALRLITDICEDKALVDFVKGYSFAPCINEIIPLLSNKAFAQSVLRLLLSMMQHNMSDTMVRVFFDVPAIQTDSQFNNYFAAYQRSDFSSLPALFKLVFLSREDSLDDLSIQLVTSLYKELERLSTHLNPRFLLVWNILEGEMNLTCLQQLMDTGSTSDQSTVAVHLSRQNSVVSLLHALADNEEWHTFLMENTREQILLDWFTKMLRVLQEIFNKKTYQRRLSDTNMLNSCYDLHLRILYYFYLSAEMKPDENPMANLFQSYLCEPCSIPVVARGITAPSTREVSRMAVTLQNVLVIANKLPDDFSELTYEFSINKSGSQLIKSANSKSDPVKSGYSRNGLQDITNQENSPQPQRDSTIDLVLKKIESGLHISKESEILTVMERKIQQLNNNLRLAEQENQDFRAMLLSSQQSKEDLEAHIINQKDEIARLTDKCTEFSEIVRQDKQHISELQTDGQKCRDKINSLVDQVKIMDEKIDQYKSQLDEKESLIKAKNAQIHRFSKISKMLSDVTTTHSDLSDL